MYMRLSFYDMFHTMLWEGLGRIARADDRRAVSSRSGPTSAAAAPRSSQRQLGQAGSNSAVLDAREHTSSETVTTPIARTAFGDPDAAGGGNSTSPGHTVEMTMRQRYGSSKAALYPHLQQARHGVETYLKKVEELHLQLRSNPTDDLIADLDLSLKALVQRETLVYQLSTALGLTENFSGVSNVLPEVSAENASNRAATTGRAANPTEKVLRGRSRQFPDEPFRVVNISPLVPTITDDQLADELKLRSLPAVRFWKTSDRRDYTEDYRYAWVLLETVADAIAFRSAFDNTDHPNITPPKGNNRGNWELRVQFSSVGQIHPDMRDNGLF
ncbi:hypothetical protein AAVH_02503 [Aphelenchoides avenae]|nr:hypothetical protein AAVH_02503 [Aphelenchus avenae]